MFQYAAGRAVSLKNNTELKLDISAFETYTLHEYSLEKLNIVKNYAIKKDIPWYESSSSNKYLDLIFQKIKNTAVRYNIQHFRENGFEPFDSQIFALPDGTYLDGYFQSDKYFRDFSDTIRADFEVIVPPSEQNRKMIEQIQKVNAVSLHIRRGDYTKPSTQALHGLCNAEYYKKSIEHIAL